MNCPYCNHPETRVNDSREGKDGSFIKRRRECLNCMKRFSTVEKVLKLDLDVLKTSGQIEPFNLSKIRKSIHKACEKRPVTLEMIEEVLSKILLDLKQIEDYDAIPTAVIGRIVLKNLKNFDEIAFLKFAIVHNNYSSIGEFADEIEKLKSFEDRIEISKKTG